MINSGQGLLPMAGVRTGLGFGTPADQTAQYFQVFSSSYFSLTIFLYIFFVMPWTKLLKIFRKKNVKNFWGLVCSLIFLVWWQIKLLGLKNLVSTIFEKGAQTSTITITKQLVKKQYL